MADKFQYTYADPSITTNACISSSTPNGTYDSDNQFCSESVNVCKFVAKRLGHPVMQLEFNSGSIYAMFEESVSEYSQQINQYNMKNWLWEQIGSEAVVSGSEVNSTGSSVPRHPHMGSAVYLSEQYGQAAGVGGNVTLKSGSVVLAEGQQNYDLQQIWGAVSEINNTEFVYFITIEKLP